MAISYIDSTSAAATSVTAPTHQASDLLVIAVYRDGSNTLATVPSGWVPIQQVGAQTNALGVYYRYAASGSETSGTWTNATHLVMVSYRSAFVVGIAAASTSNSSVNTTINYQTQGSPDQSDQWVIQVAGTRTNDTDIETPPTGTVLREDIAGASTGELVYFDTDGHEASWSNTTTSPTGTSSAYRSIGFFIWETARSVASGGGLMRHPGTDGGFNG